MEGSDQRVGRYLPEPAQICTKCIYSMRRNERVQRHGADAHARCSETSKEARSRGSKELGGGGVGMISLQVKWEGSMRKD